MKDIICTLSYIILCFTSARRAKYNGAILPAQDVSNLKKKNLQLYKCIFILTFVRPELLYGSEAWTMKTSDELILYCTERRELQNVSNL